MHDVSGGLQGGSRSWQTGGEVQQPCEVRQRTRGKERKQEVERALLLLCACLPLRADAERLPRAGANYPPLLAGWLTLCLSAQHCLRGQVDSESRDLHLREPAKRLPSTKNRKTQTKLHRPRGPHHPHRRRRRWGANETITAPKLTGALCMEENRESDTTAKDWPPPPEAPPPAPPSCLPFAPAPPLLPFLLPLLP